MKLASLKSGRDGILCVVNRALTMAVRVPHIASTLQIALDNWETTAPRLEVVYQMLNTHSLKDAFSFDPHDMASPLPRAYQWIDGSAYVNHVQLVRQARGAEMPENFWHEPLMYQGGSDGFLNPRDPIPLADASWGCD